MAKKMTIMERNGIFRSLPFIRIYIVFDISTWKNDVFNGALSC